MEQLAETEFYARITVLPLKVRRARAQEAGAAD